MIPIAAFLGLLNPLTSLIKAVFGDKSLRDVAKENTKQAQIDHDTQLGTVEGKVEISENQLGAAVQGAHEADAKSEGFISHFNKIFRPVFTLGIIGLIAWFLIDPVSLTVWASQFAVLPDWLWYAFAGVISFWLGIPIAKLVKPKKVLTEAEAKLEVTVPVEVSPVPVGWREITVPLEDPTPTTVAKEDAGKPVTSSTTVVVKKPVVPVKPAPVVVKKPTVPLPKTPVKKGGPGKKTNFKSRYE
jgi:hypothetical protein